MGKIVVFKRTVLSEQKRQGVTINAPSEVLHNVFSHGYPHKSMESLLGIAISDIV